MLLEHTLAVSTTMIGAVTGLAIAAAVAVGLGVGREVTFAGFLTKYTTATVASIAANIPSDIKIVFFIVLLQSKQGHK